LERFDAPRHGLIREGCWPEVRRSYAIDRSNGIMRVTACRHVTLHRLSTAAQPSAALRPRTSRDATRSVLRCRVETVCREQVRGAGAIGCSGGLFVRPISTVLVANALSSMPSPR
jgi:hypothetical protein